MARLSPYGSTFRTTNSSIQPWLNLNESLQNLPTEIPSCYLYPHSAQKSWTNATEFSCADACVNPSNFQIGDSVKDLIPCGLFASVAMISSHIYSTPATESYLAAYSARFAQVGLNLSKSMQVLLVSAAVNRTLLYFFSKESRQDYLCKRSSVRLYPSCS